MWAVFYLNEEGENVKRIVMNHPIPTTQTIIEAVRTRLEQLQNNALEFFGISLWQNWDTEYFKPLSLLEQPIGLFLRTEVRVFSDSV